MKKLAFFVGIISITMSCTTKNPYNISCEIEGLQVDSALIAFIPLSDTNTEIVDTVIFVDGKFEYSFPADELYECFIIPYDLVYKFDNGESYPLPTSRIIFFIDSLDQINIKASVDSQCIDYQVTGNLLSEQLTEARKMKLPLFKERIVFEFDHNSYDPDKNSESVYQKRRIENDLEYQQQSISYIKMHPDSKYSSRLLLEVRDKKIASVLYNSLTKNVKNSYFGTIIGDMVNGWMLTSPGLEFPNIVTKTIKEKEFSLNKLRGKYVLLDFWGSWCKPCIVELPKLKQLREDYQEQLEIVGIACNDNRDDLINIIESNQIDWTQILAGDTRESNYSDKFGIRNFPTKILLDKDGKVIKSYIGLNDSVYIDIERIL